MTAHRLASLGLLVVEAAAMGVVSGTVAFSLCIVLIAGHILTAKPGYALSRDQKLVVAVALGFAFYLKYEFGPQNPEYGWEYFNFQPTFVLGQYMLALQVAYLIPLRGSAEFRLVQPGMGVITFVCIGTLRTTRAERELFQWFCLAFVAAAAWYFATCRRVVVRPQPFARTVRRIVSTVVMTVVVVIAWTSATAWYRYERDIDRFVMQFLRTKTKSELAGFSASAVLGSVQHRKSTHTDRVALRVYGDDAPGYLRGKVFDEFVFPSQWQTNASQSSLDPLPRPHPLSVPVVAPSQELFVPAEFRDSKSETWRDLECWPDAALATRVFTPLRTTHVAARIRELSADLHGSFEADELLPGHPYTAFAPRSPFGETLKPTIREQLVQVPQELQARLRSIADTVFADCNSPREKLRAVVDYFQRNYQYEVDITIPDAEDPLTYFLVHRPPAHCEYFASGAAVLLRLAGVPCRYVTGFVVSERNPYGDYWVARNRDAHAWVEAFDDESWVLVEATPPSGVPSAGQTSGTMQFWESLRDRLNMLRVRWQQGEILGAVGVALRLLASPIGMIGLLGAFAWTFLSRRRRTQQSKRASSAKLDPVVAELQKLLARMDARMTRRDLERRRGETLHQFAERVAPQPEADWYRQYAVSRYSGRLDADVLTRLKQEFGGNGTRA